MMASFPLQALLILSIASLTFAQTEGSRPGKADEAKLLEDLFKNYDPRIRPVLSRDDAVPLQFGVAVVDFFEGRDNVFDIDVWMHFSWKDASLRWEPEKYGGIKSVKILPVVHGQSPVIWMPDVLLYGGRVEDNVERATPLRAIISHDGNVLWIPMRTLKVHCEPEIVEAGQPRNVTCTLKFGSWVYSALELDLQDRGNKTVDNESRNSGQWTLADYSHERKVKTYPCCPEPYASVTVTLKLTENLRKSNAV